MDLFKPLALRLFGLSGNIGAILFVWGDLSNNHVPGSKDSPAQRMSGLPENILLRAGMRGTPRSGRLPPRGGNAGLH